MQLREWRKDNKVTQTEFARAAGTTHAYISQIETGIRRPSPELAKRIEEATRGEVTAATLLGLSERGVQESKSSFEPELTAEARKLGLDPDAIAAKAIEDAVKRKRMDQWIEENKEAFAAHRRDIEENGLWCDKYRQF